jgi:FkbM family methyltransferase
MRLHPEDVAHRCIAMTGFYELECSRIALRLARRGGLLVDVGANYGYFTLLWAAARPDNRVMAFEASSRNQEALRANVHANGFAARVECQDVAVGKENGFMTFDPGPEHQTGWGGLRPEGSARNCVPVRSLDEVFARATAAAIDLLKIDTEGADTWVLQGALGLLQARRIRHILFEQYPARMAELDIDAGAAQTLLAAHGYRCRQLGPEEWYACL